MVPYQTVGRAKAIEAQVEKIQVEMKRIGFWQDEPLPDDAYDSKQAFCSDTMSLPQWLQFVFVPRIKDILATDGEWPGSSEVGIYASQQFSFFRPVSGESGTLETQATIGGVEQHLIDLLYQFDEFFN